MDQDTYMVYLRQGIVCENSNSLGMDSNKRLPKEPANSLSKVLRCQTIAKVGSLNEPSEVMAYLQKGTSLHANILDY